VPEDEDGADEDDETGSASPASEQEAATSAAAAGGTTKAMRITGRMGLLGPRWAGSDLPGDSITPVGGVA
jgi:hypothetical protein